MPIFSMYWATYPWKNELHVQAERVVQHLSEVLDETFQGEHDPMDMLDRAIMLAAFSMRRMIEKRLVTDTLARRVVQVRSFRATVDSFRPPFHSKSGGAAYSNYRFKEPEFATLTLKKLADEIIHSSQLMVIGRDEHVSDGLLIASDWHSKKRLLHLTPAEFTEHVRLLLADRVTCTTDTWSPETGQVSSIRT